ncbi:hypothetical protein LTR37_021312 [Vermiconidia calcicola]|uniref:Uncharacterized protein n=1 Tax=Vermiconidia calcicola TaxID=1690605 RepID=A0ACC3M961_9PEZI|nr:hypothetical protein LTR37_021312 [Vermiconidia calcicola]
MTKTEYALAYTECSYEELKRFSKERGLRPYGKKRNAVIHALRQADIRCSFRFLDLPPELRNHIYMYLLVFRTDRSGGQRRTCYPSILATSKQVHQESCPVLYRNATVDVDVRLHSISGPIFHAQVLVNGDPVPPAQPFTPAWSSFLSKVGGVDLSINLGDAHFTQPQIPHMNDTLYELQMLLCGNGCIHELQVDMSSEIHLSDEEYRDLLSPIIVLGARVLSTTFTFDGLPAAVERDVPASSDTMRQILQLETEANLCLQGDASVPRGFKKTCLDIFKLHRIDGPVQDLNDQMHVVRSLHDLQRALDVLEAGMYDIGDKVLENSFREIMENRKKKREQRKSHKAQEV